MLQYEKETVVARVTGKSTLSGVYEVLAPCGNAVLRCTVNDTRSGVTYIIFFIHEGRVLP